MKFCVDCKHFKVGGSLSGEEDVCTHPSAIQEISPVYGVVSFRQAAIMRILKQYCGDDAVFFEEKPTLWNKIKWLVKKKNTNKHS